jgi:D-alanine-D-alanine ligase-like ATP-grasp enzyme
MPGIGVVRALANIRSRQVRNVGAGLDLTRSTGLRYVWQRWHEERARRELGDVPIIGVYRVIWGEAADDVGAELRDLGGGFFELEREGARARVWFHWAPLDDIVAYQLALDKPRVHELLAEVGVPVPQHAVFGVHELEAMLAYIDEIGAPCVVKPARGTSGGNGVTSRVSSREQLLRARLRASRGDSRLLVERQAPGDAYRLLFLDGKLIDVVRRLPPRVVGDGSSTVAELISAENRRRLEGAGWAGFRLLTVDLEAVLTLERQGLRLRSAPEQGRTVAVKGVESQNAPRDNETVRERLSEELVGSAAAAVRAVGLRLAGVDLVTSDLSRPLRESGGVVVEVNCTPGFQYHYLVAEPQRATRIAVPILERALEQRDEHSAGSARPTRSRRAGTGQAAV